MKPAGTVRTLVATMGLATSSLAGVAYGQQSGGLVAEASRQTTPEDGAVDDGNTIVVTGKTELPSRSEVYQQARDLSRVLRFQVDEEPLARFESPLCSEISGLTAQAAEAMLARIRENAARLDVKLAGRKCSPNMIIAFVEDGRAVLSKVAETHRKSFCTLAVSEQAELLAEEAPVRVWNQIVVVGPTAHVWKCRWDLPSASHVAMLLPFRRDIVSALVVFDRGAAADLTIVQLADYATMRALSHTRPAGGDEPMPTILSLFTEGAPRPQELTSFDIGYLQSLYWWLPNTRASSKLMGIRHRAKAADEEAVAP